MVDSFVRTLAPAAVCAALAAAWGCAPLAAQEPAAGQAHAPGPHAAAPPKVDPWWEKSSLTYSPVRRELLTHIDGTLSFMNSAGNSEGSSFDANAGFTMRLMRFTNRLSLNYTRRDMEYGFGGGSVNFSERALRNHGEYDLTKHAVLVGGVDDYRNTLMFIDSRFTTYGGGGVTLVDNERMRFTVIGGIGYTRFRFDKEAMERVDPVTVAGLPADPNSGGLMATQAWTWKISPKLSLSQGSSYTDYFESHSGHLATFNVSLNIPVSRHFSVNTGYRFKQEDNSYVRALGVSPEDRSFTMGFRFSK